MSALITVLLFVLFVYVVAESSWFNAHVSLPFFKIRALVMALNKSMHPRNRYKDKPPDFGYLASKYPDFQQHVHTSLTGKPV